MVALGKEDIRMANNHNNEKTQKYIYFDSILACDVNNILLRIAKEVKSEIVLESCE